MSMEPAPKKKGFNKAILIPPMIFLALGVLFFFGLNRENPDELPSTMVGRTAPDLTLTPLGGGPVPSNADLAGNGVKLVNFWASWCGPCRVEHPSLIEMQKMGIDIIGVNYKDDADDALGFVAELGNPYTAMGADESGRVGINWGLYGVPETFIINDAGQVVMRHPGPITGAILREKILPAIKAAQ